MLGTPSALYVINPKTKRDIKVGGPTYLALKAQGELVETLKPFEKSFPKRSSRELRSSRKDTVLPRELSSSRMCEAHPQPLSEQKLEEMGAMERYSPNLENFVPIGIVQRSLEETLKRTTQPHLVKKLSERKEEGRGWSADAPKKGRDRHLLREKCGDKCFLIPDREAFPICPRCNDSECNCHIDCRGLTAAKIRAH